MPGKQKIRFRCGRLCATTTVWNEVPHRELALLLKRHLCGDWGDVCEQDAKANEDALRYGDRIISWYTASTGDRVMILTEADRSMTTILFADEY